MEAPLFLLGLERTQNMVLGADRCGNLLGFEIIASSTQN